MKHTDIVIIGAGPAGCSTSLFLSKSKIPHTIIDKAVFPRDKVCGDALSGKVVYVMKQLNPQMVFDYNSKPAQFLPSWGVKFVAPNGKHIDIPFKSDMSKEKHAPGFISKRMDFDASLFNLLDRNYANVLDGTELINITKNQGSTTVSLKNSSQEFEINDIKMLIGAEGDRSMVAKKLSDIKKENDHYCAGIRAYYEGVTQLHPNNFIELHFLEELLPGYFWIFP
jgi:flavin-dependent dehydrogenase